MGKLLFGDCLDKLKALPDNSVDSVVTDPPYGLSFMGKSWDYDVPTVEIWKEALRVLKPGGHLLAFGGTRTYHRLVVAIEDAGFEIRDQIQWLYGQGFPKSQNINKASGGEVPEGLGTALKPANEPICLARKPLSEKTVAKNVLKHGTGGLNIDGTRIQGEPIQVNVGFKDEKQSEGWGTRKAITEVSNAGRFPANVIFDEEAAAVLDEQSGVSKSTTRPPTGKPKYTGSDQDSNAMRASSTMDTTERGHNDSGGASRFFYVAKASKSDRGEGNTHPTVKPVKLMEYLVKLVTPEGGTVLDPFMGSGTTGVAALNMRMDFIGCERDDAYFQIAKGRILAAKKGDAA